MLAAGWAPAVSLPRNSFEYLHVLKGSAGTYEAGCDTQDSQSLERGL